MQDQDDALNQRKLSCKQCVENDCKRGNGDNQECAMPSLWDVAPVVENYKPLDLSSGKESDGCDTCLPTKNAQPTNHV